MTTRPVRGTPRARPRPAPPGPGDVDAYLDARMTRLVAGIYTNLDGLTEQADRVAAEAAQLDRPRYVALAALVRANVCIRTRRLSEGVEIARGLLRTSGDRLVTAYAHAVIAAGLWRLGDKTESANYAEKSRGLLRDDDPLYLRADHMIIFATLVNGYRVGNSSWQVFEHAQALVDELGEPSMIITNLNNWAWVQYERGDLPAAVELVEQMRKVADLAGHALTAPAVDTVARILLESGDPAGATTIIRTALDGFAADTDSDAFPMCLLALAEIQRRTGDYAAAIANSAQCRAIAVRNRLPETGARALRELATCHAQLGDYRTAYEQMVAFHDEWTTLRSAASEAAASIVQAMFETHDARKRSREFQELAEHDPLTGLWNRRKLDEHLDGLLGRAESRAGPVSVAILDLDHFKRVNDRFSHHVGDEVLRVVARLLKAAAGPDGSAARLGGEEFVLVLPLPADAAREHCEAVRRAIAEHRWSTLRPGLRVTTSIGVAEAGAGDDRPAVLRRADRRLYAAKRAGRDRVVASAADTRPGR